MEEQQELIHHVSTLLLSYSASNDLNTHIRIRQLCWLTFSNMRISLISLIFNFYWPIERITINNSKITCIIVYRTCATITCSWSVTALVYKPRILGLKNEEFPFLVQKLSVISTAVKNGVKNIQTTGYNSACTVYNM